MKATGIVRRIDDLGRVVIPKEIRRTLRLREGTPLEIFTDREGEIILKKYSPMMELNAFAGQYADAMAQATGLMVCITSSGSIEMPPDSWEGRWKADGLVPRAGKSPMTNHMVSVILISGCRDRRSLLPAAFQWSRRISCIHLMI